MFTLDHSKPFQPDRRSDIQSRAGCAERSGVGRPHPLALRISEHPGHGDPAKQITPEDSGGRSQVSWSRMNPNHPRPKSSILFPGAASRPITGNSSPWPWKWKSLLVTEDRELQEKFPRVAVSMSEFLKPLSSPLFAKGENGIADEKPDSPCQVIPWLRKNHPPLSAPAPKSTWEGDPEGVLPFPCTFLRGEGRYPPNNVSAPTGRK